LTDWLITVVSVFD